MFSVRLHRSLRHYARTPGLSAALLHVGRDRRWGLRPKRVRSFRDKTPWGWQQRETHDHYAARVHRQSPSASRATAGALGFFTLTQFALRAWSGNAAKRAIFTFCAVGKAVRHLQPDRRAAGSNSACRLCARRFRVCQFPIVLRDPKITIAHLRHRVRLLREPRILRFAVLVFAGERSTRLRWRQR